METAALEAIIRKYYPFKRKLHLLQGRLRTPIIALWSITHYAPAYFFGVLQTNRALKLKFMLACVPRSGSSLLGSFLRSHPDVHWGDEEFHANFLAPRLLSRGLAQCSSTENYGIKLFLHQLSTTFSLNAAKTLVTKLAGDGWKFINLIRTDPVKQALSVEKMRRGGPGYRLLNQPATHGSMDVDPNDFLNLVKWCDAFRRAQDLIFHDIEHLPLTYERHLEDENQHQDTLEDVFQFLGLRSYPVSSPHMRQSQNTLKAQIRNYEEVIELLSDSSFRKYVET